MFIFVIRRLILAVADHYVDRSAGTQTRIWARFSRDDGAFAPFVAGLFDDITESQTSIGEHTFRRLNPVANDVGHRHTLAVKWSIFNLVEVLNIHAVSNLVHVLLPGGRRD